MLEGSSNHLFVDMNLKSLILDRKLLDFNIASPQNVEHGVGVEGYIILLIVLFFFSIPS